MKSHTLRVDVRGARLSVSAGKVFVLEGDGIATVRIGVGAVRQIVLFTHVDLDTQVLRECTQHEIPLLFFPRRGRTAPCHFVPNTARRTRRRIAQIAAYLEPRARVSIARLIVSEKLAQQRFWLEAINESEVLDHFESKLDDAELPGIDNLMGIEGAASARYFSVWQSQLPAPWSFERRSRRPPRDPINALLSLSYTLAQQQVACLVLEQGWETDVGFLHEPQTGRPALTLDVLEPVRPWIDAWVLQFVSDGLIEPSHFSTSDGDGCRLTKEGRNAFFSWWSESSARFIAAPARQLLTKLQDRLLADDLAYVRPALSH